MKALTVWRPWSDAIVRGPKRVENRTWPPFVVGGRIAIHAGKRYQDLDNASEWPWPAGFVPPHEVDSPTGIVGVARLVGALDVRHGRRYLQRADDADRARLDALDRDPWWAGPVGWLLDDVVAIEPVPCRGAMGLWTVPAAVAAEVVRRVAVAVTPSQPMRGFER